MIFFTKIKCFEKIIINNRPAFQDSYIKNYFCLPAKKTFLGMIIEDDGSSESIKHAIYESCFFTFDSSGIRKIYPKK